MFDEIASARVVKTRINLGTGCNISLDSEVSSEDMSNFHVGSVRFDYRKDKYIDNFPLVVCPSMLDAACDINLFLIHRYLGDFSLVRKAQSNSIAFSKGSLSRMKPDGVSIDTTYKLAQDLQHFLRWLGRDGASWQEVLATTISDRKSELDLMPIWRYRSQLIERVKSRELSFDVATNRISVLRQFYEWAWKNHRIDNLPFKRMEKVLRKRSNSEQPQRTEDILFGMSAFRKESGIQVSTSTLALPRIIKQKETSPEESLQPYEVEELAMLLSTDVLQKPTHNMWAKLGYMAGLRCMDIAQLNYRDLQNPLIDVYQEYQITLYASKGNKQRPIKVSRDFMLDLWAYAHSGQYIRRRKKHEQKYGMNSDISPLPLFMNPSGERVKAKSVGNLIAKVRKELKEKGLPRLNRDFHDLRATFATYLAIYLLERGLDEGYIKSILTSALGHVDFSISAKYLNFAKSRSFSRAIEPWVDAIYEPLEKIFNPKGGKKT